MTTKIMTVEDMVTEIYHCHDIKDYGNCYINTDEIKNLLNARDKAIVKALEEKIKWEILNLFLTKK